MCVPPGAQKCWRMPRMRSSVTGLASSSRPKGATQTFSTPSLGARKDICRPSGLSRAWVRTGLPNSAERGMSRASLAPAAEPKPPPIIRVATIGATHFACMVFLG